jgi:hypothetical protein
VKPIETILIVGEIEVGHVVVTKRHSSSALSTFLIHKFTLKLLCLFEKNMFISIVERFKKFNLLHFKTKAEISFIE